MGFVCDMERCRRLGYGYMLADPETLHDTSPRSSSGHMGAFPTVLSRPLHLPPSLSAARGAQPLPHIY
jgi:hypothetical protein